MVTSARSAVLELAPHLTAERAHACRAAEQRLRRGRTEADDELGLDRRELERKPVAARLDLRPVRLVVDSPLPARLAT